MRGALGAIAATARSATGALGLLLVTLVLVAAIGSEWVATHDPDALDVMARFQPPTSEHWLGTDHLGRDLYSRLVHGARVAMLVAIGALTLAVGAGVSLGVLAGFLGPAAERPIIVLFDVVSSFPSLVLALAVVAVTGPSTGIVMVIAGVTLAPQFGRVARAQVLALQASSFLEAERILGASTSRIVRDHVLPNILGPIVVLASMDIPVVITIEAGLSFLGLGVRPPLASWGVLIQDGYQFLSDSWVPVVVSSAALGLATLGFTLWGEALRDAVDPRIGREP